jgi:hypothetical protein
MNERIKLLAEQAKITFTNYGSGDFLDEGDIDLLRLEKFAELIVRECINQAHSVGDLRGANDDMIYGADTAAVKISKHFGVEE